MNTWPAELPALLAHLWKRLETAGHIVGDPFRTVALATATDGEPAARIVVLREADAAARTLTAFSDNRAAKVQELRRNPHAQWLFFDPRARVQIRASGPLTIHHGDDVAFRAWEKVAPANRANYAAPFPPGSEIAAPTLALPMPFDYDAGRDHFTVIRATIERLDWLELGEPHHRRAAFAWTGREWKDRWLVP